MLPATPVALPSSSTTTTCISSFSLSLDNAYSEVPGFSAIEFQEISPPLLNPNVCELYQSFTLDVLIVPTPLDPVPTISPPSSIINIVLLSLVVVVPSVRVNINVAPAPTVDIPEIVLSTVIVPIPDATVVLIVAAFT